MSELSFIVIGGTGLIGSGICEHLAQLGARILSLNSSNYAQHVGAEADVLINCNGNTFRFRANKDPAWDFEKSVVTVERSLIEFRYRLYLYFSTVDVYNVLDNPTRNHEGAAIDPMKLDVYGFHKWVAERLVERFAPRFVILRLGTVLGKGLRKGPIFDLLKGELLHMSLDSELTFVDTTTIARTISAILAIPPMREIYNVTGSSFARLRDLPLNVLAPVRLAVGARTVTYHYDVNNAKIAAVIPMPTSMQVAVQFLEDSLARSR